LNVLGVERYEGGVVGGARTVLLVVGQHPVPALSPYGAYGPLSVGIHVPALPGTADGQTDAELRRQGGELPTRVPGGFNRSVATPP
jgi:hypothetical protein